MSLSDRLRVAPAAPPPTLAAPEDRTLVLLRKVREYLSSPDRWTREFLWGRSSCEESRTLKALDGGYAVDPDCPACLEGATFLVTGQPNLPAGQLKEFYTALGFTGMNALTRWNDDPATKHADVLARLDEAIRRLEVGA